MNTGPLVAPTLVGRAGHPAGSAATLSTGYGELDELLPGGGWPRGSVSEILLSRRGAGSLRLLLPTLARLSRGARWICWVAPPQRLDAPALAAAGVDLSRLLLVYPSAQQDGLAVVEESLRLGNCAAVLAWPMVDDAAVLCRLQRAAEAGDALGFLFRQPGVKRKPSSTVLRVRLGTHLLDNNLAVSVLKPGGGQSGATVVGLDTARLPSVQGVTAPGGARLSRRAVNLAQHMANTRL